MMSQQHRDGNKDNQLFMNGSQFSRSFPSQPEYVFHGLGEVFHLVLRPDSLALPDKSSNLSWPEGAGCFYSGHVSGAEQSSVAVSLCRGMVSEQSQFLLTLCLFLLL